MSDTIPLRLSDSHDRWMVAATIGVACFVCALVVRELRVAELFAASRQPATASASAIPAEAVSISTLLAGGHIVRVGDPAAGAVARLSSSAVLRTASDDRGANGRRQIRSYEVDDASVIVVLEPFEPRGALRVSAIYLR